MTRLINGKEELKMKINKGLLKHVLFFVGFITAFWGSFEMAYQSGNHPIWSGTWGFPIVHHYVVGYIIIIIVYLMFTQEDWMVGERLLLEVVRMIDKNTFKKWETTDRIFIFPIPEIQYLERLFGERP